MIKASTVLVFTLIMSAIASASAPSQSQIISIKDDHTAAALKRVTQKDDLKRITAKAPAPTPTPPPLGVSDDIAPIEPINKPKIAIEPAPGANELLADPKTVEQNAPALAPSHNPNVSAEQALRWLGNGNHRYVTKKFRADGRSAEDRKRLLNDQRPHAIVLSCSDSRVPPEIVFDQVPGEIFVVRVAGEALDSSVIASIEYAVEHLGSRLLVVMGHTQCGAVSTVLNLKDGESAGSESLDKLLADIRPRLRTVASDKRSPQLEVESTLNADGVARDLLKRSEIVRKKVESGELVIKPALYRMDSGKVTFY